MPAVKEDASSEGGCQHWSRMPTLEEDVDEWRQEDEHTHSRTHAPTRTHMHLVRLQLVLIHRDKPKQNGREAAWAPTAPTQSPHQKPFKLLCARDPPLAFLAAGSTC